MKTLRNVLWLVVGFGLMFCAGIASAQDQYIRNGSQAFKTSDEYCVWAGTQGGTASQYTFKRSTANFSTGQVICYGLRIGSTSTAEVGYHAGRFALVCPVAKPYMDWTLSVCVADKPAGGGVPPPKCDVPSGQKITFDRFAGTGPLGSDSTDAATEPGYPTTSPTCGLTGLPDVRRCYSQEKDGKKYYYCTYEGVSNGAAAPAGSGDIAPPQGPNDPRENVPPVDAPDPSKGCPKGTVNAGLNSDGVPRCVGTGTDPKNKPPAPPKAETEKTETSSDGTKTTTKTEITFNSDGSQTIVKTITVVKPDGTKEINQDKSTTDNSAGKPGKDESGIDDERFDLCKQNPNLTICTNSSVGGKCGQITCQGDAIQCASLRAIATMECRQVSEKEELMGLASSALGNSILSGNDPMQGSIDAAMKGTEVEISSATIEQTAFLPAACLINRSVTLLGKEIRIDFTRLCSFIEPLRYVFLAMAWIVAYRIIIGVVLRG